jgi:hypothetical protein
MLSWRHFGGVQPGVDPDNCFAGSGHLLRFFR